MNKPLTIAIDGYASSGKSTLAKDLASELGYIFIDSGAMYRAVALFAIEQKLVKHGEPVREALIKQLDSIDLAFRRNPENKTLSLTLNGNDVSQKIRSNKVSALVSSVALFPEVRTKLVALQRAMGNNGGVVMDGRDIGTVVFPDAEIKFFVIAEVSVRAERRQQELASKGHPEAIEEVQKNLEHRDFIDTTRAHSPLKQADGAFLIDTTLHTRTSQLEVALQHIENYRNGKDF
jgi:cytidylate kinase